MVDTATHRQLFTGNYSALQSSLEHGSLRSGLTYIEGFHLAMMAAESPKRVLFLGGGGCVGPLQFAALYPGISITVVEKSAQIMGIAYRHFNYEGDIVVADAADFVAAQPDNSYDVVLVDVYDEECWKVNIPGVYRIGTVVMLNELSGFGTGRVFKVPGSKQILDLHGGDFKLRPYNKALLPCLAEIADVHSLLA